MIWRYRWSRVRDDRRICHYVDSFNFGVVVPTLKFKARVHIEDSTWNIMGKQSDAFFLARAGGFAKG